MDFGDFFAHEIIVIENHFIDRTDMTGIFFKIIAQVVTDRDFVSNIRQIIPA